MAEENNEFEVVIGPKEVSENASKANKKEAEKNFKKLVKEAEKSLYGEVNFSGKFPAKKPVSVSFDTKSLLDDFLEINFEDSSIKDLEDSFSVKYSEKAKQELGLIDNGNMQEESGGLGPDAMEKVETAFQNDAQEPSGVGEATTEIHFPQFGEDAGGTMNLEQKTNADEGVSVSPSVEFGGPESPEEYQQETELQTSMSNGADGYSEEYSEDEYQFNPTSGEQYSDDDYAGGVDRVKLYRTEGVSVSPSNLIELSCHSNGRPVNDWVAAQTVTQDLKRSLMEDMQESEDYADIQA